MSPQFGDLVGQPEAAEAIGNCGPEIYLWLSTRADGVTEDFSYLLLGRSAMGVRATLQGRLDVLIELSYQDLRHKP